MVDLHTHILFDIDDGSESLEESLEILREAEEAGVKKIALTPHFTVGEDIDDFLTRRNERVKILTAAVDKEKIGIELTSGAEVYITRDIFDETELERLVIGKSRVMLSEFKYHGLSPKQFLDYVDEICSSGILPLIAHPERYSYLRRDKMLLNALLSRGALLQINAVSLFEEGDEGNFARAVLKNRSVSVMGSDVHKPDTERLRAFAAAGGKDDDFLNFIADYVPNLIFEGSDEIEKIEPELM
ncbi:MAG: PHP domain-containing protein [Clostridia bacterium]|nr:PHP domain-containing protein [Clostridia bacterium]